MGRFSFFLFFTGGLTQPRDWESRASAQGVTQDSGRLSPEAALIEPWPQEHVGTNRFHLPQVPSRDLGLPRRVTDSPLPLPLVCVLRVIRGFEPVQGLHECATSTKAAKREHLSTILSVSKGLGTTL